MNINWLSIKYSNYTSQRNPIELNVFNIFLVEKYEFALTISSFKFGRSLKLLLLPSNNLKEYLSDQKKYLINSTVKEKRILAFLVLIASFTLSFFACNNSSNINDEKQELSTDLINNPKTGSKTQDTSKAPQFYFDEEVYDFGKISQGEKVTHSFKFKNVGKSDLIISSATGSCGCTIPEWPKEPIKPGDEGTIKVLFNSKGKSGKVNKKVTIIANTVPNTKVIAINAEILISETKTKN